MQQAAAFKTKEPSINHLVRRNTLLPMIAATLKNHLACSLIEFARHDQKQAKVVARLAIEDGKENQANCRADDELTVKTSNRSSEKDIDEAKDAVSTALTVVHKDSRRPLIKMMDSFCTEPDNRHTHNQSLKDMVGDEEVHSSLVHALGVLTNIPGKDGETLWYQLFLTLWSKPIEYWDKRPAINVGRALADSDSNSGSSATSVSSSSDGAHPVHRRMRSTSAGASSLVKEDTDAFKEDQAADAPTSSSLSSIVSSTIDAGRKLLPAHYTASVVCTGNVPQGGIACSSDPLVTDTGTRDIKCFSDNNCGSDALAHIGAETPGTSSTVQDIEAAETVGNVEVGIDDNVTGDSSPRSSATSAKKICPGCFIL